jgi:hypothetical protein
MGIFNRNKNKEEDKKKTLTPQETAFKVANNVFKDLILADEKMEHAINGKCEAENLVFSIGILVATTKRVLYYWQDGSKTGTETIMYDKIISITAISGFESKMGSYIGVAIELANGRKRIVRCLDKQEYKDMIKEIIFYIESKR